MSTERNHEQLKKALAQLPVYEAAEGGWERLSAQLDASPPERRRRTLTGALGRLPVYPAPVGGWRGIARRLPLSRGGWRWGVAAGLALLLGVGGWWLSLPPVERLPLSERRLLEGPGLPVPEPAHFDQLAPLLAQVDSCYAQQMTPLPPAWQGHWEALVAERVRYDSLLALPPGPARQDALSQTETRLRGTLFQLAAWLCPE